MNTGIRRTQIGTYILLSAAFFCAILMSAEIAVAQEGNTVLVDGMEVSIAEADLPSNPGDWFTIEDIPGGGRIMGDFVVGPGKIELEVAPGESKTVMVSVTNRTGERREFILTTEDMTGSKETDKTVDLLGSKRGPYSLKDYVYFGGERLQLNHNERARIPVTITIPANADPGGRYGSVLVRTVAIPGIDGEAGTLTPQSPIIARIGTLFFVTVPGEIDRQGQMTDFTTVPDKLWFESGPINFNFLFENTGSVHLAPYGILSITNSFDQEVGYIELDPWFVMPGSIRSRDVEWTAERLLGRYTATLTLHRGYNNKTDEVSITFWVLPWKVVAGTFAVVFLIVFLLRSFFKTFEFRRKG